jgi:hypothetical protein
MSSAIAKIILNQPVPKLCRDCKFFKKSDISVFKKIDKIQYGVCTYQYSLDLVTGEKKYDYASIVRQYTCKETFYEENEKTNENEESWWKF